MADEISMDSRITIAIPKELLDQVDEWAKREHRSRVGQINAMLDEGLALRRTKRRELDEAGVKVDG